MLKINGKVYKINLDLKWGTEKLMKKVMDSPEDPKSQRYIEFVIKDLLIPSPTNKEMFNFRKSDVLKIFDTFTKEMSETNTDFKKKLSQ